MITNFIDCYLKSEKDSTGIGFLTAIREIRQSEERILNKTSSQLDNASQKIIESVLDSVTNHIEKLQVELHKLGVTEKDAPSLGGLEKDAQAIQAAIHELQSPLTGIMAHTENIARESKKDKPNFERIDKQLEAVLSLCHMLSYTFLNVLGYSSVAGYRFGKANIAEILNRIVSVYKPMAKSNNNMIVVELRDDTVLEVSWALELAINNIVNNAVRFSFPKGFEKQNNIRVFGNREGQFYKLSVMNFGIPIFPDEYDKVFENGYRSRLAKDVSPSGIGRGLFVAKAIIEQHNGKIYVSSKQEKEGYLTTFLVYLPYSQPSSEK